MKTSIANHQRHVKLLVTILAAAALSPLSGLHAQTAPAAVPSIPSGAAPAAIPATGLPQPSGPPAADPPAPDVTDAPTLPEVPSGILPPTAPRPDRRAPMPVASDQPAHPGAVLTVPAVPTLEQAIIDEETSANPTAAAEKYRAIVAAFDARRAEAAQTVFRLGECLRRLGRTEEAKVQYGRILREFVDQPELVKWSGKFLAENTGSVGTTTSASSGTPASKEYLRKNLDLLREQIAATETSIRNGAASHSALIPLRRQLLRTEQQLTEVSADSLVPQVGAQPSPSNDLHQGQLAELEQRIAVAQEAAERTASLIKLIDEKQPEALPIDLITDPRFKELKKQYQDAVLVSPVADENVQKSRLEQVEQARGRIGKWLKDIYQPELASSEEFERQQLVTIEGKAERLRKQINERAETEASMAKTSAAKAAAEQADIEAEKASYDAEPFRSNSQRATAEAERAKAASGNAEAVRKQARQFEKLTPRR